MKKKKKILTRKVYYWESIRDVSYYADLYGKSKYESISITLFNGSYKKNITTPEEYDLSHFFSFRLTIKNKYDKELDAVLKNQSKSHNVHYELKDLK
ncbi:MAG: hypothetical protein K6E73_02675 [Bacteroidales bacterium]|nr:hypothetical protein [Bacteroidales bacterium]